MRTGSKRLLKSVGVLTSGRLFGQIATLLALPVLSRLYSPDEFGVLSYSLALTGVLVPIALLRLDRAVLLPESDSAVSHLFWAAISSLGLVSVGVGVLIGVGLIQGPFTGEIRPFIAPALALLLFAQGFVMLLTQLAVRSRDYQRIGINSTVQSLGITVLQFVFVPFRASSYFSGLVLGALGGSLLGAATLFRALRTYIQQPNLRISMNMVRTYWRFPVIFAPTSFLSLLLQQVPLLFVGLSFGAAAAGQLGMADRITAIPLSLIGLALGDVLEGEAARLLREKKSGVWKLFIRISVVLAVLGSLLGLGVFCLGSWIFPWFLGDEWHSAGLIARSMGFVVATRLLSNPTRRVLMLFQRGLSNLLMEIGRGILAAIVIGYALVNSLDLLGSITMLFGVLAISDIALWSYTAYVVRSSERGVKQT